MRVVLLSTGLGAFGVVVLIASCSTIYNFNTMQLTESNIAPGCAASEDVSAASFSCPSSQPSQADTVSLLQGGRVTVERLSEDEVEGEVPKKKTPVPKESAIPAALLETPAYHNFSLLSTMRALRSATSRQLTKLQNPLVGILLQKEDYSGMVPILFGIVAAGIIIPIVFCTLFQALQQRDIFGSHAEARKREAPQYPHGVRAAPGHSSFSPSWRQQPPRWSQASLTPSNTVASIRRDSVPISLKTSTVHTPRQSVQRQSQGTAFFGSTQATPVYQSRYQDSALPSHQLLSVERVPRMSIPSPEQLPPPLRSEMVLKVEGRFGVPLHDLHQLTNLTLEGILPIVGYSGDALLVAKVQRTSGNKRSLTISRPQPGSLPYATVEPRFSTEEASHVLSICGSKGVVYGTLEQYGSRAFCLSEAGVTVLSIDGDTVDMQFDVQNHTGSHIGAVLCSSEPFGSPHLEVRVAPSTDTVLVVTCILAYIIFWSE
mmetsp:Transcript_133367/g.231650  ORF Transcript_133367/g.231650 Transcript_133367/m.231650 type:complete len:487 (+) Transcript_133367:71-1531(+)